MIFGVDVHPQFQAGLNIEQVRAEGFDFLAAKVSQGTTTYDSMDWLRRAKACGLLAMGYHFLEPGNETAQARVFAGQLRAAGVPGMLDAEYPLPSGDTLSMTGIRGFLTACQSLGVSVPLIYLPRWYWQRMGSPDLTGLPRVWASSYVAGTGYAATLVEAVTPRFWAPYGGLPVSVLQFTDRGLVAGQNIDVDVFPGTRDDLATLLTTPAPNVITGTQRKDHTMAAYRLDPTPIPVGATPDTPIDGTWEAVEDTITAPGPAGGWSGRVLQHLTFGYRGGFIQEAWSAPSGKHFVTRYDPTTKMGGLFVDGFVTQHWELPAGDIALIVRYATRARGSVTPETQN
jgi:GH25 family lysozyme M1 (1,4-beta-N-acetylmuramidase)